MLSTVKHKSPSKLLNLLSDASVYRTRAGCRHRETFAGTNPCTHSDGLLEEITTLARVLKVMSLFINKYSVAPCGREITMGMHRRRDPYTRRWS